MCYYLNVYFQGQRVNLALVMDLNFVFCVSDDGHVVR